MEHFKFEEDFVEENVRCIPMIVRFKLDACGVKLKLAEWSKFTPSERTLLATALCDTEDEVVRYRDQLRLLVWQRTGSEATPLSIDEDPLWSILSRIPDMLLAKLQELGARISLYQWQNLSDLQRFALIKLSAANHEQKNFPTALKEFNLF